VSTNQAAEEAQMTVKWSDLKLTGPVKVRDLWAHADHDGAGDQFTARVSGHGVVLLRVSKPGP